MVRPEHFGYNSETASSNAFQKEVLLCDTHKVRTAALGEFDAFVRKLRDAGIRVFEFGVPEGDIQAPDAVFPNNWISFHEDGTVIMYPMLTPNRRVERRQDIIDELGRHFVINKVVDLSGEEQAGRILEGTGSIVFDHVNKTAYANRSARTNKHLFYDVCARLGYKGVYFDAVDAFGQEIYHTNVLMAIGSGYAIICREAIAKDQAAGVINQLQASGLEVVEISYEQMNHFAGNMIELTNAEGARVLVMSESAHEVLTSAQKAVLSKYAQLLHADLKTIETVGGGSARCMIADIHLPTKK